MADPHDQGEERALQVLLMKLRARDLVRDVEEEVLRDAIARVGEVAPGRPLVSAHVTLSESILLFEGLACRYKDLADGQRQIMELHVPGDFVDLHSFLLKRLEHKAGSPPPATFPMGP